MTSEEAIKILMSDADFGGVGQKAKQTADALCMAVDALENQRKASFKRIKFKTKPNGEIREGVLDENKQMIYTSWISCELAEIFGYEFVEALE